MNGLNLDLSGLSPAERAALARATYFTLTASYECDDGYLLNTIEDAEDDIDGDFSITIGVPDRPAFNRALTFDGFVDAVAALEELKRAFPAAGLWLSTRDILAEIKNPNVWRGTVEARAELDRSDDECSWNALKDALAERDATGAPIVVDPNAHAVIAVVAAHL